MTDRKVRGLVPLRLILAILMAGMILYLGVGFVRQASASHQRQEELRRIEQEIAAASQKNAWLEERLQYVHSVAAAEEWARENGWAKEDEISVVVVAPWTESSSDPGLAPKLEAGPRTTREAWWDWFFGDR
jgi:cell division protein FtsL